MSESERVTVEQQRRRGVYLGLQCGCVVAHGDYLSQTTHGGHLLHCQLGKERERDGGELIPTITRWTLPVVSWIFSIPPEPRTDSGGWLLVQTSPSQSAPSQHPCHQPAHNTTHALSYCCQLTAELCSSGKMYMYLCQLYTDVQ